MNKSAGVLLGIVVAIGVISAGGAWYTGTGFPEAYRNKYFHSDWGAEVIKLFSFDANNRPTAAVHFANVGPVV